VDLSQSQLPPSAAIGSAETWDEESVIPSSGERPDMAPPAKSRRPEGFPDAGTSTAAYRPPPVEDDVIVGGDDDQGLAPEIEVNIEEEVEDLNADLVTTDRQSDSPHALSPRQETELGGVMESEGIDRNNNDPDYDPVDCVLVEVPSTQPPSSETPPRQVTRRHVGTRDDGFRRPVQPLTPLPESTVQKAVRGRGRGIHSSSAGDCGHTGGVLSRFGIRSK